jgi:hypothetical protein
VALTRIIRGEKDAELPLKIGNEPLRVRRFDGVEFGLMSPFSFAEIPEDTRSGFDLACNGSHYSPRFGQIAFWQVSHS